MGEPALQLLSTEAALGEAAAKQTARLIVIEGGKSAALATGELAVSEGVASTALRGAGVVAGGTAAAAGAFLVGLLWPSILADGTLKQRATLSVSTSPAAVPQANEKVIQECPGTQSLRHPLILRAGRQALSGPSDAISRVHRALLGG